MDESLILFCNNECAECKRTRPEEHAHAQIFDEFKEPPTHTHTHIFGGGALDSSHIIHAYKLVRRLDDPSTGFCLPRSHEISHTHTRTHTRTDAHTYTHLDVLRRLLADHTLHHVADLPRRERRRVPELVVQRLRELHRLQNECAQ